VSVLSDAILALSPSSYWKFGEPSGTIATDSAGANTGTYTDFGSGGVVLGQPSIVPGDTGTSVRLVLAVGGNITFGNIFNFTGAAQFTALVWGRLSAYNAGTGHVIFQNAGAGVNGWEFDFENPAIAISGYRCDAAACDRAQAVVTQSYIENRVHLYSICYDGTNIKVGLDGTYIGSTLSSRSMTDAPAGLTIGSGTGGGSYWDGWLQHAAVFSSALSEANLKTLVTAASGVEQHIISGAGAC